MKRAALGFPFVLLAGLSVASRWIHGGQTLGNIWVLAFLGCLLLVPLLSRRKLWLGYAALLYPFLLAGVYLALDWGSLNIGLD